MSQINVNPSSDQGDRTAAAGINLVTVLITLVVIALVAWFLFAGPLRGTFGGSNTNINVNPPVQQQSQPQPQQQSQPQSQPQQQSQPQPQPQQQSQPQPKTP